MEHERFNRLDMFTRVISLPSDAVGGEVKSYQLAGAGARALAGLTDLAFQLATFALIAWFALESRPDLFPGRSWVWAAPLAFVEWHIIYLMLFESFTRGTTPGKNLWRLRVITVKGEAPGPVAMVIRNVARIFDLPGGIYLSALIMINLAPRRQRLGDRLARLLVIYDLPLARQLNEAEVPESLYSTSEDGYLLESWVERERRFELESRVASGVDLAVYLHRKYNPGEELQDPGVYLRNLYEQESNAVAQGPPGHPGHSRAANDTD